LSRKRKVREADALSSPVIDKLSRRKETCRELAERQASEVQRQTELASKRLVEETRRQVEENLAGNRKKRNLVDNKKKEKRRTEIQKGTQAPPTVPVVSIQAYAQALKHALDRWRIKQG